VHVKVHVGFTDSQDIPKGLALAVGKSPELDVDLDEAHYFLSVLTVQATGHRGLRTWRKRLYAWMYHNAASRTEVFHLPPERTIVMGAHIDL
jgi:KUP system potassium uptake protein